MCLAETNTNWSHTQAYSTFKTLTKKTWQQSVFKPSHCVEGLKEINQPGGTMTLVTGNSTSRVIDCQTDPFGLGRWSYFIIQG